MDGQQAGGQVSRIDVVSDAICPWCWVGKRNLDGALAILAAEGEHFAVHWRPYQLNPEMPREGVERAAYRAARGFDDTPVQATGQRGEIRHG